MLLRLQLMKGMKSSLSVYVVSVQAVTSLWARTGLNICLYKMWVSNSYLEVVKCVCAHDCIGNVLNWVLIGRARRVHKLCFFMGRNLS